MVMKFFVYGIISQPTIAFLHSLNDVQTKVAFIFAGSPRSFVLPIVHESIRENLIASFCPIGMCLADVFIRLSLTDNQHEGTGASSLGIAIESDQDFVKEQCANAFEKFTFFSNVKLYYNQVNIGSIQEKNQMNQLTENDFKQRIYQDLDPRRYSMYFNRWKAYNMMLDEELKSGQAYSWIVHARLDQLWWAPIESFDRWLKKIWIPDFSFSTHSDASALLPRNISDAYFDIDYQFRPSEIMCLGGPNFNPNSSTPAVLRNRGYSTIQIEKVQNELCLNKFANSSTGYNDRQNVIWSHMGMSEAYLRRRFQYYGLSEENKTLGFSTFYMVTARNPLKFVCYDLLFFVGYKIQNRAALNQHVNAAYTVACTTLSAEIKQLTRISPTLNCTHFTDIGPESQFPSPLRTCITDRRLTRLNFMPFRLLLPTQVDFQRAAAIDVDSATATAADAGDDIVAGAGIDDRRSFVDACVTAADRRIHAGKGGAVSLLSTASCVASYRDVDLLSYPWPHNLTIDYSRLQLFSVYPHSHFSQRITSFWNFSVAVQCLTVSKKLYFHHNKNGRKLPLAVMTRCGVNAGRSGQLFRIHRLDSSRTDMDAAVAGKGGDDGGGGEGQEVQRLLRETKMHSVLQDNSSFFSAATNASDSVLTAVAVAMSATEYNGGGSDGHRAGDTRRSRKLTQLQLRHDHGTAAHNDIRGEIHSKHDMERSTRVTTKKSSQKKRSQEIARGRWRSSHRTDTGAVPLTRTASGSMSHADSDNAESMPVLGHPTPTNAQMTPERYVAMIQWAGATAVGGDATTDALCLTHSQYSDDGTAGATAGAHVGEAVSIYVSNCYENRAEQEEKDEGAPHKIRSRRLQSKKKRNEKMTKRVKKECIFALERTVNTGPTA